MDTPKIETGLAPEWVEARCTGCDRHWSGQGTLQSRQAVDRAQRHANRTGHVIDLQHANRR